MQVLFRLPDDIVLSRRVKPLQLMSYELIRLPYCIANMKKPLVCLGVCVRVRRACAYTYIYKHTYIYLYIHTHIRTLCVLFPSASFCFLFSNISNMALSYRPRVFALKNPSGTLELPVDRWINRMFLLLYFYPPLFFVLKYRLISEINFSSQKSFCVLFCLRRISACFPPDGFLSFCKFYEWQY